MKETVLVRLNAAIIETHQNHSRWAEQDAQQLTEKFTILDQPGYEWLLNIPADDGLWISWHKKHDNDGKVVGIRFSSVSRVELKQLMDAAPAGSRWDKIYTPCQDGKFPPHLSYQLAGDGWLVEASDVPLPESCKIEYEDVLVPEHVEKRVKVKCSPDTPTDEVPPRVEG